MSEKHFNKISFYIVAHADDWQLFMYPNVYNNLVAPHSKVVIIITTAGDAGANETYWIAREEGSKSSVRFCLAPIKNLRQSGGVKEFNEHAIHYWCINNAVFYFLRLPDGNLNGNGFAAHQFQSLSKLEAGEISSITAVDNSTTYKNWLDFYTTLQTIIVAESNGISKPWINYLNPDASVNPNDHADHVATGHAIQVMPLIAHVSQALFQGYNASNTVNKLNQDELFWKSGMFAVYEKAVFDNSGYSTLQEGADTYLKWCASSADFIVINSEHK